MGLPSLFHCDECKNNITGIRYHKSGDCDLCVTCFESLSPSAQGEYTPASNCFYKRPRGRNKKGMLWDSTFGKWVSIGYEPTAAPTSTPKKRKQIHEATTELVTTARVTRVTRSTFGKWVSIGYEPTAAPTSTPKKRKQIHEATTEFVTTARVTRVTRSGY